MATVDIERLGGFAGFGGPGSRLRSRGSVDTTTLSERDQRTVDDFFTRPAPAPKIAPDSFVYRLTRQTQSGPQTVQVAEGRVPDVLKAAVKDQIE